MSLTEKISVTIGRKELRGAKRLASRLGLSLSTFISDAVRRRIELQARWDAAAEVLATFAPEDRATPAEMRTLLERWGEPGEPRRSRRKGRRRASVGRIKRGPPSRNKRPAGPH